MELLQEENSVFKNQIMELQQKYNSAEELYLKEEAAKTRAMNWE